MRGGGAGSPCRVGAGPSARNRAELGLSMVEALVAVSLVVVVLLASVQVVTRAAAQIGYARTPQAERAARAKSVALHWLQAELDYLRSRGYGYLASNYLNPTGAWVRVDGGAAVERTITPGAKEPGESALPRDFARAVTPADFVSYSALRVDATRVGNGTFRIHGSVYVRGDWEFKGNSQQLNDRPVSEADDPQPVYDNQTFVCGNLVLQGNAQIGMPGSPMLGVHIAGRRIDRGGAAEIYTLLQDATVPDIRLANVFRAIRCIRGEDDPNQTPPLNGDNCNQEFPGLWNAFTNHLDDSGLVVLKPPGGAGPWVQDSAQNLTLSSQKWRIPKRDKVEECKSAPQTDLRQILQHCAAYYDGSGNLYVAAGQVIYIPGILSVQRDVNYRVDDDPSQPCDAAAGDADPCRKNDAAMFVVACESDTNCDPNLSSPAYGFDVQEMLRAARPASNGPFYPQTTFPTRDLLAVLVHGRVRFGLSGNPANQEINAIVASGCDASLPPERCDLTMQKNLQLYGSVISRLLVFEQNVDLFQVPDLRRYLPFSLDRFLSAPGGSAVVVTQWREVGF